MGIQRHVNKLAFADMYRLGELMKSDYHKSGKTDGEFATWATEQVGVTINEANVQGVRTAFGITSNRDVKRAAKKQTISERIRSLEEKHDTMLAWWKELRGEK